VGEGGHATKRCHCPATPGDLRLWLGDCNWDRHAAGGPTMGSIIVITLVTNSKRGEMTSLGKPQCPVQYSHTTQYFTVLGLQRGFKHPFQCHVWRLFVLFVLSSFGEQSLHSRSRARGFHKYENGQVTTSAVFGSGGRAGGSLLSYISPFISLGVRAEHTLRLRRLCVKDSVDSESPEHRLCEACAEYGRDWPPQVG
jgi:hypothetical protein